MLFIKHRTSSSWTIEKKYTTQSSMASSNRTSFCKLISLHVKTRGDFLSGTICGSLKSHLTPNIFYR